MGKDESNGGFGAFIAGVVGFIAGRITKEDPTPKKELRKKGVEYLIKLIREWRPVDCKSESDYHIASHNYLLGRFTDENTLIETEYGIGKSRIDIVIDEKYGIELKANLKSENEIKRLGGQVQAIKKHLKGGLLVICGETTEDIFKRLKKEHREAEATITHDGQSIEDGLKFDVVRVPMQF
ncbi:MAG: hypothetical protein K9N46_04535 [Candidatus Marinimicrobia bacterium]|nr:hypothetical protein [Candidatus Neomarinimicrobiota bacterium]MCF7829345.1 hypothetical protein [Candidatus Neomarinimicrobiota bacterium]MCF7879992.1 hypothetical protein [Candidatus Neomarinimicrobiota bacterium]